MAFESFNQFVRGIQNRLRKQSGDVPIFRGREQNAYARQVLKEIKQEDVLHTPLKFLDVVVFDIETTGFYPEHGDEIISIGAVKVSNGKILEEDSFYTLTKCNKSIPKEITDLTGIRDEMLADAPLVSEAFLQLLDYANHAPFVAHHSKHEKSFLQHISWNVFRRPFKQRIIDTSFLYRIAEGNSNNYALEELCEINGVPVVNRHHALEDAKLTAKLWCIYVEKVMQLDCTTLQDIYVKLSKK